MTSKALIKSYLDTAYKKGINKAFLELMCQFCVQWDRIMTKIPQLGRFCNGAISTDMWSFELRVIGTNAHRVDTHFFHLKMHT